MSTPEDFMRMYGGQALQQVPTWQPPAGAMNTPGVMAQPPRPASLGAAPASGQAEDPLKQYPDEMFASMLGTAGDVRELGAMEDQIARAQALRDANVTPEGRNAGRVFVAANPLEHLGKGIKDYQYGKRERELEADAATKRATIGENEAKYGGLILDRMGIARPEKKAAAPKPAEPKKKGLFSRFKKDDDDAA